MDDHMDEEIITKKLQDHGYQSIAVIGKGAFGSCRVVHSIKYNEKFVCKVVILNPEIRSKVKTVKDAFEKEKLSLRLIDHPNVIKLYDHWSDESMLFLVVEFCTNKTLEEELQRSKNIQTSRLLNIIKQISKAMAYLHKNRIVHHDIKPSNIFLDKRGNIKIGDFGLSEIYSRGQMSEKRMGTLNYMAPEIFEDEPYDPFKADVWAFGVTIYNLYYGKLPFEATNTIDLEMRHLIGYTMPKQGRDTEVALLISKCLKKDPKERPTFEEIYDSTKITTSSSELGLKFSLQAVEAAPGLFIKSISPKISPVIHTPFRNQSSRLIKLQRIYTK